VGGPRDTCVPSCIFLLHDLVQLLAEKPQALDPVHTFYMTPCFACCGAIKVASRFACCGEGAGWTCRGACGDVDLPAQVWQCAKGGHHHR